MLKFCRTCLLKSNDIEMLKMSEKVIFGEEIIDLTNMIMTCVGIEIPLPNEFSNEICKNCLTDLKIAYNFRQRCWLTEKSLKSLQVNKKTNDLKNEVKKESQSQNMINNNWDIDNIDCNISKANDSEYESQDSLPLASMLFVQEKTDGFKSSVDSLIDPIDLKPIENVKCKKEVVETKPFNECSEKLNCNKYGKGKRKITERKMRKSEKRKHEMKNNPKMCDLCGKILSSPKTLRMHKRCVHINEKKFACHICPYRGNRKANLTTHMRVHTGERPFSCELCDKTFQTQGARQVHRRMHFDDAPFVCNICNKAFKKRGLLNAHKNGHDDSRRVPCQYCDKGFHKEQLRNHEMTHINERPFSCEFCGNGFIQKSYFKRHIRDCEEKFKNGTLIVRKKYVSKTEKKIKVKTETKLKFNVKKTCELTDDTPKTKRIQDICLELHIQGNV